MADDGNVPSWYCARAKPGQDALALANLRRQDFEAYYPMADVERVRKARLVRESVPVFPGYILVRSSLDAARWRAINGTRGVLRLLSFGDGGIPSRVPDAEVERLKEREKRGELRVSHDELREGSVVRLRSGYAVDAIGTVVCTSAQRVELLISLLNQKVRVISPRHAVEVHI